MLTNAVVPTKNLSCFPFTGKPQSLLTFQVIQRFRTKMPYTASSELWMSPQVRFCALNDGKIPKRTPVCEPWCLLCIQRNQRCDQNLKFSYRKIKFVKWWGLLSFAFRNSALTYHCKWLFSWKKESPSILFLQGPLYASPQIVSLWIWVIWGFQH